MKSKALISLSMILLLVMFLIACGGSSEPAATTDQQEDTAAETEAEQPAAEAEEPEAEEAAMPAEPIIFVGGLGGETGDVFQDLVDQWNEAHPESPVQFNNMQHEDLKQGIRAMLLSDPAPDIMFWGAGNRSRFFVEKGLLEQISDVWVAGTDLGDNTAGSFRELATVDGEQYLVPESYHWWSIWYRPSVFDAVGLTPPETWDELLAACDTLNEAGITPITIGNRFKWPAAGWFDYISMRINSPEVHTGITDLEVAYDDPQVKEVFEYWNQLFEHNCFIEDSAAYDWQEAVPFLVDGSAGMYLMGSFILEEIPDEAEEDLDFFQFPIIDPDVPVGEDAPTDVFIIPLNAANPEGGKAFATWMSSQIAQQYRLDTLARLPTRTDLDLSDLSGFAQKGIEQVQSADYVTMFYDRETTPEFAEKGMDAFLQFWDNPENIDQILADLEAARQEYLATQEE